MNRFVRNTAFSSLAGFCTAFGGLASAIFVARLLGPSGSGVVIYCLWVAATIAAISDGGLSACLARFIPELTGQGKQALIPGLIRHLAWPAMLLVFSVPLVVIAVVIFAQEHANWLSLDRSLGAYGSAVVLVLCATQTLSNLYLCVLRGLQRFNDVARLVFLSMLAQVAFVVGGAAWGGVTGALAGYLIGSLGPALLAFGLLRKADPTPRDLRIRVRRYALFTWAANLTSLLVWSRLEIVFLKHSFGDVSVGMFSVGLTLASLAVQGPLLFAGGLLAFFSERTDPAKHSAVETALCAGTRLMAAVIMPISFGLCALTPRLIPLLYGPGFEQAAPAAMILIGATGFGAIGTVVNNLLFARERSDVMLYCNIGGGLIAVIGGFLIIPMFGLVGAATLRAAVQTAMLAVGWTFVVWRMKYRLPLGQVALLTGAALVCALAAHVCLALTPGLAGLGLAIIAGAIAYLLALRVLGALPLQDLIMLQAAVAGAPVIIRGPALFLTHLIGGRPFGAFTSLRRTAT